MYIPPSYKTLLTFIGQLLHRQRWVFSFIFLVPCITSLGEMLFPYLSRLVIDILTQYDVQRSAAWSALKLPVLWWISVWIMQEVAFRCQGLLMARTIPRLEATIRMKMFIHIQKHSPKYFNEQLPGSLANKITDMTTQVTQIVEDLLYNFIPALVSIILAIFCFFRINLFFSLLVAAWSVTHFSICIAFTKKCIQYEQRHSEARSTLLGRIVDSFTNNFAVNLFYRFLDEQTYIARFQQEERAKSYQSKKYIEILRFFLGLNTLLGGIGIHGLILYAWIHSQLTTGAVVQISNTTWIIIMMLWDAGLKIPALFQSIGIAKQALSVMQHPSDVVDCTNASSLVVTSGEIVFDHVSFCYEGKKILENQYAHIRSGEKVGIVGYSGAGKSTFVKLILRLYPVDRGKILIDGQDISQITLASLRQQVTLIPQEPLLFHRSLQENIHYGKCDATQAAVLRAAQLAHCDEFIQRLPKAYHTLVGERGSKLSGGERQRIAIARAILANTPILILDEATSALDSVTEQYIQAHLESLMANRTTLVIAHRLSTLKKMDRILYLDQGKIVEEGSHEVLLALNSHYTRMWQMQTKGFLPVQP